MKTHYEQLTCNQIKTVYALAAGLFANMLNPDNQGPNFCWDEFHIMARGHVESNIFMYGKISENDQTLCGDMAVHITTKWLKDSGLIAPE